MKKEEEPWKGLAPAQPDRNFAWKTCEGKHKRIRVAPKQQAVDDGFTYAREIRARLEQALDDIEAGHATAFDLMGGNEIRAWIDDMADVELSNSRPEILVGVAGATGAGKMSLLNALLEYPELLPSSSADAATATKGSRVSSYIRFRTEEAVVGELSDVLTAFKERKELRTQEFETEDARAEAIDVLNEIISKSINKVCAVWSLDECDIEDKEHTVESIISNNAHVVDLLGTTLRICSDEAEDFANEIKPYLDSTATPDGIMAWPLIEEVRLFVRSEILKHGIISVDLPGLSDMVADRSAIAKAYYQKLFIMTIVTPAIRAVAEKTAIQLTSNYQELRMQLDSKYTKDSFCVVASKIDDLDVDAFCKGDKEARRDAQLQADVVSNKTTLNEFNETSKELRTTERKIETSIRKFAALTRQINRYRRDGSERSRRLQTERKALMTEQKSLQNLTKSLSNDAAQLNRALATLESRTKFRCVGLRNQFIKNRFQEDFARRQRQGSQAAEHNNGMHDGAFETFPVSASAFSDLLKGKKTKIGFPSKLYTGMPRLRRWLEDAVLVHREGHLDRVLSGLQRLHDGIRIWSDDNSRGMVHFSRKDVERLLQCSHAKCLQSLTAALTRRADNVQHSNPLRNKDDKLASCGPLAVQTAGRWVYKYPDEPNSTQNIHWKVYDAILKKDGGPYHSSKSSGPYYDFPLSFLVEDWVEFFHVKLLKEGDPLVAEATDIWGQYMNEVGQHIQATSPDIYPYFKATGKTMFVIQLELCNKIMTVIKSISEDASQIHPLFIDALRRGLKAHFTRTLRITGE
ncbi:hypothetical protein N658DRAFT_482787 [Parathielavia hyrcaniae]|uniref:Dynamin N-terminal domain-containing protein n=1 Tax=Parathielavia hyrcaniae TaxID=113614 RepID=A0AAN6QAM3_9PEZI|nr:hypothetical protein N658DRAFT_482787 [Parathielavia hyrcaniae]